MIQEFFNAAFPWIILAIALAIVIKIDDNPKNNVK